MSRHRIALISVTALLLVAPVPALLYSNRLLLPPSAVTVTSMLPTPVDPSGSVKAIWRALAPPAAMLPETEES